MTSSKKIRLTFLTGPLTQAGRFYIYHSDTAKTVGFVRALMDEWKSTTWKVWIKAGNDFILRTPILRKNLEDLPLRYCDDISKLRSQKRLQAEELARLLPIICHVCHDRGFFSIHCLDSRNTARVVICEARDVHVYANPVDRARVLKIASNQALRCVPPGISQTVFMDSSGLKVALGLGDVKENEIRKRDLSISPLSKLR